MLPHLTPTQVEAILKDPDTDLATVLPFLDPAHVEKALEAISKTGSPESLERMQVVIKLLEQNDQSPEIEPDEQAEGSNAMSVTAEASTPGRPFAMPVAHNSVSYTLTAALVTVIPA